MTPDYMTLDQAKLWTAWGELSLTQVAKELKFDGLNRRYEFYDATKVEYPKIRDVGALIDALRSGSILARGRHNASKIEPIPAIEWQSPAAADRWSPLGWSGIELPSEELRRLFPASSLAIEEPDSPIAPSRNHEALPPGPKPGGNPNARAVEDHFVALLNSAERPPRGHGFRTKVAEEVQQRLKAIGIDYSLESIRKMTRSSLNEWEAKHPPEMG